MKHIRKRTKHILMQAVDTVLPPRCAVSGDVVDAQGMLAPQAWKALSFIAAPMCASCGVPFDFEVGGDAVCTDCLERPPAYKTARAALHYDDASRDLILGFKHADKTQSVVSFIPWMSMAGAEMIKEADVIMPVPLHYWRLVKRRYNQAAIIAQALSAHTKIPVHVGALKRIRATASQGHLNADERRKNVKRAFVLKPDDADKVKGQTVLLVDDVLTTGATVNECARTLMKHGAKAVHVLTLARVVKT